MSLDPLLRHMNPLHILNIHHNKIWSYLPRFAFYPFYHHRGVQNWPALEESCAQWGTKAAWNSPGSVFLRRGCNLLATLLLLLVPLQFTWLLACCWSLRGVFVVLSSGSDASRRRGDVGVGGAPLAMLLRLDVELLRLPGPNKGHVSEVKVLPFLLVCGSDIFNAFLTKNVTFINLNITESQLHCSCMQN
jgi:hypothetical protein